MSFVTFFNLVKDFIATLPPLFVITVVAALGILIALAIKRAIF